MSASRWNASSLLPLWEKEEASPCLAKSQVDALAAHQRVYAIGKRRNAVKEQPRRAAPDHDVAMLQPVTPCLVGALQAAEQEDRGQSERYRDDRRGKILLVLVLV